MRKTMESLVKKAAILSLAVLPVAGIFYAPKASEEILRRTGTCEDYIHLRGEPKEKWVEEYLENHQQQGWRRPFDASQELHEYTAGTIYNACED
ncbi:MAG: hypothetical protein WDZ69_02655 [Candidatus Pacearchaeota archaeon]